MLLRKQILGLFVSLGIIGLIPVARAETLSIRQNLVGADGARSEVTVYQFETEEDRQKIVTAIETQLAADVAENPDLLTHFEVITDELARGPASVESTTAEDPAEKSARKIAAGAKAKLVRRKMDPSTLTLMRQRFGQFFTNPSNLTLAVVRGSINWGVTSFSLFASSHLPLHVALSAGALTGAMSGGFQFWNAQLQTFLTSTAADKLIPKSLLGEKAALRKGMQAVEPFFRWYALEVGFVSVIQVALTAMGHGPEGTTMGILSHNLVTAAAAVLGQGFWDVGVSKSTKDALKRARSVIQRQRIQLRANLFTLALSALSVAATIGKLSGVEAADYAFGGMALTGMLYFLKVSVFDQWCARKLKAAQEERNRADERFIVQSLASP